MRDFFKLSSPVHFVFPIDGDCLNIYDGVEKDDVLYINVKIAAPKNAVLTLNGKPAVYDEKENIFKIEYPLYNYRNTLCACDSFNCNKAEIVVYRFKDAVGKYRFTVDDTVVVFYDLAKNPEKYPSLFDHPFLKCFKTAHNLYGTVTNLNIYYEYDAVSAGDFTDHKDYFNLSMMPDSYRAEWEANSDWLTLSYHAHNNYPNMPFKIQSADFVRESIRKVHSEIIRFAGPKSLSRATTQHFGNGYIEQLRTFRENGYPILFGSFRVLDDTEPYMSYYGADGLPAHVRGSDLDAYNKASNEGVTMQKGLTGRDFWHDNMEDITYCRTDMVLNVIKLEDVEPWLKDFITVPQRCGYLNPMIHEEYFYPDYMGYIPDCTERVLAACKFAYEHGYSAAKPEQIVFEK